ncbi:hypothetical protein [Granulicella arctica]|uniref:hypothetical protein n=1 Tax=Granulicella arctica TaxID=940613 RepID=UPI0021E0356D|nr:hypothetical protein [Granulicella arctica]
MKINVIKNGSGKAIATYESTAPDGSTVTPVLPEGHTVEEREVEADYQAKLHLLYA